MSQTLYITKANGKREPFSAEKLLRSMKRARVEESKQHEVLQEVESRLYDGVSTKNIYGFVQEYLRKFDSKSSCIYNLKQAIMKLGPSGYPFEKYVAAILDHYGFETKTGQLIQGKCVSHEVDVVATKEHEQYMIECKFHNQSGLQSDIKIALYVKARYDDVLEAWKRDPSLQGKQFHGALFTNTKCSRDAIAYAQCTDLSIVGWGYPDQGNLQDMIEKAKLYPVTCISCFNDTTYMQLLERGIVLVSDIVKQPEILKELHLPESTCNEVLSHLEEFKQMS